MTTTRGSNLSEVYFKGSLPPPLSIIVFFQHVVEKSAVIPNIAVLFLAIYAIFGYSKVNPYVNEAVGVHRHVLSFQCCPILFTIQISCLSQREAGIAVLQC
ncbi:hypothetical protein GDO81_022660 [Engystomops pustulosus]|uniref:Uncharacterized protein n=1 Tax=Engystomops pustulosus TaxID=76066 RepID=A0AAV6YXF9_ENGPU|nr:hypothetical protein GDO81_022660 [Engystomops pustulosus]